MVSKVCLIKLIINSRHLSFPQRLVLFCRDFLSKSEQFIQVLFMLSKEVFFYQSRKLDIAFINFRGFLIIQDLIFPQKQFYGLYSDSLITHFIITVNVTLLTVKRSVFSVVFLFGDQEQFVKNKFMCNRVLGIWDMFRKMVF